MSFDDLHIASPDALPASEAHQVDVDALRNVPVRENGEFPADGSELPELLARMDSANAMADGVEAKLDEILGTLDALLTNLEPKDTDKPQAITMLPSETQSLHPPPEQP